MCKVAMAMLSMGKLVEKKTLCRSIIPSRDAPLNSNDIVITRKTMGKYTKTVDDLQYRLFVME